MNNVEMPLTPGLLEAEFAQALQAAVENGVELLIYTTHMKPDSMTLGPAIPYTLEQENA